MLVICSILAIRRTDGSSPTTATLRPSTNLLKVNLSRLKSRGRPSTWRGLAARGQRSRRFMYPGRTRTCSESRTVEPVAANTLEDGKTVSWFQFSVTVLMKNKGWSDI